MKRFFLLSLCFLSVSTLLFAQDDEGEEEKKGFKKENLFTGGTVSLGFSGGSSVSSFSIGASPVFGYSITKWLDAGIVINYTYGSSKLEDPFYGYKSRISNYGGGAFTKIYPFKFLYIQAQFEHNFSHQKFIYQNNTSETYRYEANSFLIGAGYASGRDPDFKRPFFYIGLVADVSGDIYSPYVDASGSAIPLIWTGFQIPLFQGKKEKDYDAY